MNERIKQLAEQADYYAYEQYDVKKVPYSVLFNQKFAELIVKECIAKVEEAAEYSPELYGVALDIAEHFGVGE